jgi:hypothetical protein
MTPKITAPIAIPTPIPAFAPVASPVLDGSEVVVVDVEEGLAVAYVGVPVCGNETIVNRSSGATAWNWSEAPISQLRSPPGE